MITNKSRNKYDAIIIILLISLAFGNIGGSLQVSRILAICFFPLLLQRIKQCSYYIKKYFSFFVFFISYSVLSLLWSPNPGRGLEELVYFVIHILLFFEILCFSRYSYNTLNSISIGWLFSITLTLLCAVWELTTDNHFAYSFQESEMAMNTGSEIILRRFASVTFGNYNSYVTFLCLSLPFGLYLVGNANNYLLKVLPLCVVAVSFVVIVFNASRGGLLCMAFLIAGYTIFSGNNRLRILSIISICTLMFVALYFFGDSLLAAIVARSSDGGLLEGSSRFVIWNNALKVFFDYIGFGTGLGGIESAMKMVTNDIVVPHNLFLEVFVEFGMIIGMCFCFFIVDILKKTKKVEEGRKMVLLLSLITLPVASIINSLYLLYPFVFAYFASIIVFTRLDYIKSR